MKRVVISCGPIPAKLDSVKFLTNRFKGGLAFKTAASLASEPDMQVTIVKWLHTPLPDGIGVCRVVDVEDVVEYAEWFEDNARDYDAFVMAAAVANLMPSEPYAGKFPSHLYKVGEKFNIGFEIAPRAIDVVKKANPRCCLIGYKLFDAANDDELIDIARHTLEDAKANVIFANRPSDAKDRKIAVMADGAAIPMGFDEHVEFMKKAIRAEYFHTEDAGETPYSYETTEASALVEALEGTFPGFGTVAFRVPDGMVTTARGHKGTPVLVTGVDMGARTVRCTGGRKATLNAPLLWRMLEEYPDADYVIHRHFGDPLVTSENYDWDDFIHVKYEFPGTLEEARIFDRLPAECVPLYKGLRIAYHGYVAAMKKKPVDWGRYYEQFPEKYFGTREEMEDVLKRAEVRRDLMSLEVGGNTRCRCRYNLDPYMPGDNVISYADLKDKTYDIIVARNSISYLSEDELRKVADALKPDGVFLANAPAAGPDVKISENSGRKLETAVRFFNRETGAWMYSHSLILDDQIYVHQFYDRKPEDYERLGFKTKMCGPSTILISRP